MIPVRIDSFIALRDALAKALEQLRLRHRKAEVIDLADYFAVRRLRRAHEQLEMEIMKRDLLYGPPNDPPEPPGAA